MEFPVVKCKHCGKEEKASYVEATKSRMVKEERCFTCDYWLELAKQHAKDEKCFVVAEDSPSMRPGEHLQDGGFTGGNTKWNGFGGRLFEIEFLDGRKSKSNNVWYQGPVPERFKHLFTRKARVIEPTGKADKALNNGSFV